MKTWMYLCAALVLMGFGVWKKGLPGSSEVLMPPGSGFLIDAKSDDLVQSTRGHKLTLLNLWASWCGPCKEEFPALLKLREKYRPQGLEIVFLSIDRANDRADVQRFLASQKVDFQTFIAGEPVGGLIKTVNPGWMGAVPSTFLFDASGKRIDSWQGERRFAEMEAKVGPLLK